MKKFFNIKKNINSLYSSILFVFLFLTINAEIFAQTQSTFSGSSNLREKTLQQLVADFILVASDYILTILVGLTVLVFVWGLMKFMYKGQGSDEARVEGRKLMLWGVIGIFVITSVWGIVAIVASFIGHENIVIPQFR